MQVVVFARHPGGGIRTYFHYVYGDAALKSHTFKLVTPKSEALQSLVAPLENVSVNSQTPQSAARLLGSLIREVVKTRPDLVHSHGFTAGLIAALPLWLMRIPHIITTHDVFMPGQFKGPLGKLKKLIMGWLFGMANVLNPVGEDAAENFRATFPALAATGKIIAVTNGIRTRAFLGHDSRDLRAEASIPENALVVGFFGRFMAQKGFGVLVNALERWNESRPDRPLHVCCFGWGGFIREEQADIERRRLSEFFHFFPATDLMAGAIRGVDVVVMPSRWEACPLLPMEVMVSGRPLIASNCIGMNEVVEGSPTLVFDVGSVEGLLDRLEEFESRQPEVQAAFDEYRKEAAERFDVSVTSSRLADVFASALEKPGSAP
ncbi:glycosyltransferase family 4 protein [Marinobacter sp. TBZ242]|uniref:Glycosyltransferase family 4 protein n=1 Tax=Marinobacter azerbaijanicus TaxID=3050455 RepID=A0ABT7I6G2_9GAMM|nr:glycosyltransferase family 4 protein [Marinobacter sp. TBZ242]MDL0429707.1 glycosyltransferase family 4 protein [Marinobacter sp. TBZ242]